MAAGGSQATRLERLLHWVPGERALVLARSGEAEGPRPLAALEGMEQAAALLAQTAAPQAERARRLTSEALEPVPLLAGARSLHFYDAVPPATAFEVTATIQLDEGELALVAVEAHLLDGERLSRGELRYLLVPGTKEHARELEALSALHARLLAAKA